MAVSVEAWALARALLILAERKGSWAVHVYSERGACRLHVARGALIAVTGPTGHDDSLGDVLLRSGDLDAQEHLAALAKSGDGASAPVGAWLLAQQLATRGAVLHALRAQLRGRMRSLLSCRELSYAIAEHDEPRSPAIEEPPRLADVLLGCLRAPLRSEGEVREGELRISSLGRTLLSEASLWPEEEAVAALLLRCESRASIDALCRTHPRAHGLLCVLESLGGFAGATGEPRDRGSYGLLLRKRNQIRQGDSPYRLLDLPPGATSAQARKALRQFAVQLHPDALGPDVPDGLRRASTEVMGALIDAERSLRLRPGISRS